MTVESEHSALVMAVRLIGYWAGARDDRDWPDPADFVDPTWALADRDLVAGYLVRGTKVNQYRGLSDCRFCRRHNGSAELTDGYYCWPEGLAHYIVDHAVRLPDEFVLHVRSIQHVMSASAPPKFDHLGQRDHYWPSPSPWGEETPWNDKWWAGVVRRYLEQGGSLPSLMSLPRPCRFCGRSDGASEPTDETFCCIEGLATYLLGDTGRGGREFDEYRRSVIRPLLPPLAKSVKVDPSWWIDQRGVCS